MFPSRRVLVPGPSALLRFSFLGYGTDEPKAPHSGTYRKISLSGTIGYIDCDSSIPCSKCLPIYK